MAGTRDAFSSNSSSLKPQNWELEGTIVPLLHDTLTAEAGGIPPHKEQFSYTFRTTSTSADGTDPPPAVVRRTRRTLFDKAFLCWTQLSITLLQAGPVPQGRETSLQGLATWPQNGAPACYPQPPESIAVTKTVWNGSDANLAQ